MPNKFSSRPTNRRRYDDESGMKRSAPQRNKKKQVIESESESFVSSDSELESELEMPAKDDSRRKKKPAPKPAKKSAKDGRSKFIKGEEDAASDLEEVKQKETDSKVAPHVMLLLGSVYHLGLSAISRPSITNYLPSFMNAMEMLTQMCFLVSDNTLLHEMCPEFFTGAIFLFYSHVYYYQVLRARAAAGSDILTRIEKRVLTYYERVGQPEAWPIAAPMIGFIHGLGCHKPEDPMYSWIVPRLLDYSVLNDGAAPPVADGLAHLNNLVSGQQVPLVPAYQKLVYNFATSVADFNNGIIRPVGQNAADATHQFCGIQASAGNSNAFQALASNVCWHMPSETGQEFGIIDMEVKRARINRWSMPDVINTQDLRTLQGFLGFQDGTSFNWMNRLLSMSSVFNRFFPGSTTLAEIPPLTTLGMTTVVDYEKTTAPLAVANNWFQWNRNTLRISRITGYSNTESGLLDVKMATAVSNNVNLANSCVPAAGRTLGALRNGPFYNDGTLPARAANPLVEAGTQLDPARRFAELLTQYYDNKGGRA